MTLIEEMTTPEYNCEKWFNHSVNLMFTKHEAGLELAFSGDQFLLMRVK